LRAALSPNENRGTTGYEDIAAAKLVNKNLIFLRRWRQQLLQRVFLVLVGLEVSVVVCQRWVYTVAGGKPIVG
jgi:hypothetical protein